MKAFFTDVFGFILLVGIVILLVAFPAFKQAEWSFVLAETTVSFLTIFLSILIEAFPFLLAGALMSALIGLYIKPSHISKWIPKHPFLSLIPALILACLLPICECAIVPVIRNFIRKGVPIHVAVAFMTAAPILNPIVAASTYYAFNLDWSMVGWRMGLAFICTCLIAIIMYVIFRHRGKTDVLLDDEVSEHKEHVHEKGIKGIFYHTADDFLFMARYFVIGAFLASLFQTFFARDWLALTGDTTVFGIMMMMGLGYLLSLCSEADAFIAASFGRTFSFEATLSFLIYGPMLDLKNTLMMLSTFKWRFILAFHVVVTVVVFLTMLVIAVI
ncbi:permease [Alkalihalobacillus sp. 1P02AB]|uniref:permease n=1 Tax=Alkalihalobacillus sp. 1P02AB TaxID=3132260 RepID=UPI0039A776C3